MAPPILDDAVVSLATACNPHVNSQRDSDIKQIQQRILNAWNSLMTLQEYIQERSAAGEPLDMKNVQNLLKFTFVFLGDAYQRATYTRRCAVYATIDHAARQASGSHSKHWNNDLDSLFCEVPVSKQSVTSQGKLKGPLLFGSDLLDKLAKNSETATSVRKSFTHILGASYGPDTLRKMMAPKRHWSDDRGGAAHKCNRGRQDYGGGGGGPSDRRSKSAGYKDGASFRGGRGNFRKNPGRDQNRKDPAGFNDNPPRKGGFKQR